MNAMVRFAVETFLVRRALGLDTLGQRPDPGVLRERIDQLLDELADLEPRPLGPLM